LIFSSLSKNNYFLISIHQKILTITDLPDEIIHHISSFFSDIEDNNNFRNTSRLHRSLIDKKIKTDISNENKIEFKINQSIDLKTKFKNCQLTILVTPKNLYICGEKILDLVPSDINYNLLQIYKYNTYDTDILVFYKNKLMFFSEIYLTNIIDQYSEKMIILDLDAELIKVKQNNNNKIENKKFYQIYTFSSEIMKLDNDLVLITKDNFYPLHPFIFNEDMDRYDKIYKNIKLSSFDQTNEIYLTKISIIVYCKNDLFIPLFYIYYQGIDSIGVQDTIENDNFEDDELKPEHFHVIENKILNGKFDFDYESIIYDKNSMLELSDKIDKILTNNK
jgi:hypothetical protein